MPSTLVSQSLIPGKFCQEGNGSKLILILTHKVLEGDQLQVYFVLVDQNGKLSAIPADIVYNNPSLPLAQLHHGTCAEVSIPRQDTAFVQGMERYRSLGYKLGLVLYMASEGSNEPSQSVVPVEYVYHGDPHCCHCSTGLVERSARSKPGSKRPACPSQGSLGKRLNVNMEGGHPSAQLTLRLNIPAGPQTQSQVPSGQSFGTAARTYIENFDLGLFSGEHTPSCDGLVPISGTTTKDGIGTAENKEACQRSKTVRKQEEKARKKLGKNPMSSTSVEPPKSKAPALGGLTLIGATACVLVALVATWYSQYF